MSTLLLVAAAVLVLSVVSLALSWRRAVQGYEDEAGFHAGVEAPRPAAASHELTAVKPRRAKTAIRGSVEVGTL